MKITNRRGKDEKQKIKSVISRRNDQCSYDDFRYQCSGCCFSDDTSTVEEQSVGSAEEEAPEVEDGSEFQSDAAEAFTAVAVSSANFPDAKFLPVCFRQY